MKDKVQTIIDFAKRWSTFDLMEKRDAEFNELLLKEFDELCKIKYCPHCGNRLAYVSNISSYACHKCMMLKSIEDWVGEGFNF